MLRFWNWMLIGSALTLCFAPSGSAEEPKSAQQLRKVGFGYIDAMSHSQDPAVHVEGLLLLLESFPDAPRVDGFGVKDSPDLFRKIDDDLPDLLKLYRKLLLKRLPEAGAFADRLESQRQRFASTSSNLVDRFRQVRRQYLQLSKAQRQADDGSIYSTVAFAWDVNSTWAGPLRTMFKALQAEEPNATFAAAFRQADRPSQKRHLQAAYLAFASVHPELTPQWQWLDLRVTSANLLDLCYATAIARRQGSLEAQVFSQALRSRLRDMEAAGVPAYQFVYQVDPQTARALLPDLQASVSAPSLGTFAGYAKLSALETEQLLLTRPLSVDYQSRTVADISRALRDESHLQIWLDAGLSDADLVDFRDQGTWLHGISKFAQENNLAFARLATDVYWLGPEDRLAVARETIQASRAKIPGGEGWEPASRALRQRSFISCIDLPLNELASTLQDQVNVPIVIDGRVNTEQPVSFDACHGPLHLQLSLVCQQLGLDWSVDDGPALRLKRQAP